LRPGEARRAEGSKGTAPAGDAAWQDTRGWPMPAAGRWRRRKGEKVSKPPAAAGGIRRAGTRETGTSVTIDGHPVNLVHLPGLGADGQDEAGAGGGRAGRS